jgi:uncharacterized repeat protein (TIGR01451 family)
VSIALGSTISNVATVNYDYLGTGGSATSTANFVFNTPPLPSANEIIVSKSIISPVASYSANDNIQFKIQIEAKSASLINPILADLLPVGVTYVAGSWIYDTSSGGDISPSPIVPNFQVLPNYNGTGRTLLRWSWTNMTATGGLNRAYTLPSGERFTLKYTTKVTSSTLAGTNTNPASILTNDMNIATASQPCKSPAVKTTDTQDLDGDGNVTEGMCSCTCVNFTVASVASLESVKWDKGELDATWLKYPSVATTVPGGTVDYQLRVKNVGNISMKNILFVDIFPYVGDKGVVVTGANRLSEWRPVLIAPINAGAGVKTYYSTEQNPCRNELAGLNPTPFPTGCVNNSWSLFPPALITDVQAVKFDFGTLIMLPGDEIVLDWKMIAPPSAPQNNEVAWNSFGYVATKTDDNATLLPAEPVKVGIKIQAPLPGVLGNKIWLDANMNGIQNVGELGIDGIIVDLYKDNGDGIPDLSNDLFMSSKLTFDGGLYSFTSLVPAGYFVVFHVPPTYGVSPPNTTLDDQDSDGTSLLSGNEELTISPVVQIASSDVNYTLDQGLFPQPLAALGGYTWFDSNANGLQDEATTDGLNGITVKLYKNTNGTADPLTDMLIATTTTQADNAGRPGYYLFDDLTPANYYVVFTLTSGATFTTRGTTGTSDIGDADPNTTTGITEITSLVAYEIDKTWDAGLIIPTGLLSLGDIIWNDTNNNGIYELGSGETGINGILVNLYQDTNSDGVFSAGIDGLFKSTTTFTKAGELGYYIFENLPAGNYIVQIDNSNFDNGSILDGYGSSTGNGIAPDPDNNSNNDDNGEELLGYGIVSKAITLSTNGEPINDGDTNNNTNRSLDFGVYLVPCNTITSLVANDAQLCMTATSTALSVQTNNATASGITFVYYNSAVTNPYDGNQAGILATVTGNGTSATLSSASFPMTLGTYYIYAILTTPPASLACRPFAATSVTVIDCSCHLTSANLTVFCHDNSTPTNASDDYMQITIRPTGQFIGFNGYTYSGAFSGAANYGITTSLQSALGTAGAGNLSLVIADTEKPTCTMNVTITDPGICSTPSCVALTNPSADVTLCAGTTAADITVSTTTNTASSIKFVKFADTDQIAINASPTVGELTTVYGGTVIATVTPTGASSPYTATYTFATSDFTNVGTTVKHYYIYAILTNDASGACRPFQEIKVTVNPLPTFTSAATDLTCYGANDGTLTINSATGTAPFTYSKDDGATFQSNGGVYNNLLPAFYQPAIKDANGCVKKCN